MGRTLHRYRYPIIVGLTDRKGRQLGYFHNPKDGVSYTYVKHSSAESIAFQNHDWSPENNLRVVELKGFKIGITICHDMYLSLLMRYLAQSGAEILINPSGTRVRRKKWARILRARAIENRAFTFCTLHDVGSKANQGHVFGFSPAGEELKFTNLADKRQYTSFETTSENLYEVEIEKEPRLRPKDIHTEVKKYRPRESDTTMVCKVSGRNLDCIFASHDFSFTLQDTPAFYTCDNEKIGIIPLKAGEISAPEEIFRKVSSHFNDCKDARLIFWNFWKDLDEKEYVEHILPIVLARVTEWCSPYIISVEDSSKSWGFEIANRSKDVHEVQTLDRTILLELSRAWGISSAFKMCKVKNFPKFQTILSRMKGTKPTS